MLYRHRRARLAPLIHGGEQEAGRRAGTENVAAIAGAGKAAEIASGALGRRGAHTSELQMYLLSELLKRVPHVRLNGPQPGRERLPNSLNLSFEFVEGEGLALMLDAKGLAISSGAACVTKSMRVPPVLAAIGLPESLARGSVIISFGEDTMQQEVSFAVETIANSVTKLREMSPLWEDFQAGRISSEIHS